MVPNGRSHESVLRITAVYMRITIHRYFENNKQAKYLIWLYWQATDKVFKTRMKPNG